ncbi:type II toxin-antitoxin system RelE/ParE family toxin [Massilia sp.]|uniref:type II toxin-antitoxin system RelE/ParE family toxin n=1 Tax=Massilia sp. TaxID=1882437 RepID=UPI002899A0D7|nr:type II toxin-antitoxin system RelE/ParE family toxin [Massilia sp.]
MKRTLAFRRWYDDLADTIAKTMVSARIERVQAGLYGDVKPCGKGVSELRINHGPGYRVYFTETLDNSILLLLVGGDKSSQQADIGRAQELLAELKDQRDISLREKAAATRTTSKARRR